MSADSAGSPIPRAIASSCGLSGLTASSRLAGSVYRVVAASLAPRATNETANAWRIRRTTRGREMKMLADGSGTQ